MDFEAARREQARLLAPLGFHIVPIKPDGNCLFRAVAHQIFNEEERHGETRKACVDYLRNNKIIYRDFVQEKKIDEYLDRMRKLGEWGDHLELHALSVLYGIQIDVFTTEPAPTVIYAAEGQPRRTVRLFYNSMSHYDSVVCLGSQEKTRKLAARSNDQKERLEQSNAVICRGNLASNGGATLRDIIGRSLAQMESDFARQTSSALKESEKISVEDEITQQMIRETAREASFDLFSSLLSMGYSDSVALECVINFGSEERDLQKVVNFITMSAMF